MPLNRGDADQAARYLQHARELLERQPGARTRAIRDVLDLAIRRLSPGDFYAGGATAEIRVLQGSRARLPARLARTYSKQWRYSRTAAPDSGS
jgi:hypothetical protein